MIARTPERTSGVSLRILGAPRAGGSAEVLEAALDDGTRVALKVAHDEAMAPVLAAEARAAVVLEHAGAPPLLDCGWARVDGASARLHALPTAGARPALVFAWMEGEPIGGRTLDERQALAIVRDVAASLGAIHAAGWAHGDVSLANVLVGVAGAARLVDVGLATPLGATEPRGATLRYFDPSADAQGRDLCALGALVAELAVPALRTHEALLDEARRWVDRGAGALAAIAAPLLAPAASARPRATWAAERAARSLAALDGTSNGPAVDRRWRAGEVRSAYLRVRLGAPGAIPGPEQPAWLARTVDHIARASLLDGSPVAASRAMAPLDPLAVSRWLIALVGAAAADWPVDRMVDAGERRLEAALVELASESAPAAWTLDVVERALGGRTRPPPGPDGAEVADVERAAVLALGLAAVPADVGALLAIEEDDTAPDALVLAAADALRLRGEVGRARALLRRACGGRGLALAAEVHRRAGDPAAAAVAARAALADGDPTGRARAVLGRLALDAGDVELARRTVEPPDAAGSFEILVLAAAALGDVGAAREAAARGRAVARSAEERARIAGALGYALADGAADEAHAAFREAADHAARAAAVEDEATYRTGEAATAVSEGHLGAAVATGTRAALLWEARGRPERAARAMLACAAALATVGRIEECDQWAALAIERADAAGDLRAAAFAALATLDARRGTAGEGPFAELLLARHGAGAIAALGDGAPAARGDALRLLSRAHLAGVALEASILASADEAATDGAVEPSARLDWWGARAERPSPLREAATDDVLAALVALVAVRAPIEARGRAAASGFELAARTGRTDVAARLAAAAREAARGIAERAGDLADAARRVPWIARWIDDGEPSGLAAAGAIGQDQARELLRIVRSLEGRERLADLLDRIVDALVAWTGVERGLLLLPAPDGRLVPRAARRLGRGDLAGDQLELSQTIARRALEAGEPVVAVDASGEMADVHRSVHALRLRSVLAVPLVARGEVLGVVYLDDRVRRGAFGPRELAWARTVAALAATVLAEARERVLLRREARRARRAQERLAVELARREVELEAATQRLSVAREREGPFRAIVGESAALVRVLRTAERVARSNVPVLVSGESGTGKELFARALHEASPRATGPFVSENCSAIPETLLESTLFGHERGAFTGADRARIGLFEAAHGGTLFLDEIGEMSLPMQAKLLRVLEDGQVRPVGGTRSRRVDVRIVAATHRDLEEMVADGAFREDLFYRLNIVTLAIPPLRDRREDVAVLVRHFVARHAPSGSARVSRPAMDRLVAHDWPGNVRQLENELRRALVLADDVVELEHLTDAVAGRAAADDRVDASTMRGRIDALESALVREALEESGGNVTHAARALGVSRFGLQKMVKRLGIERAAEPPPPSARRPVKRRDA